MLRCFRFGLMLSLLITPDYASAGFKDTFSQWQAMDRYAQYSYVMGMYDSEANNGATGEETWVAARRAGLAECAQKLGLNPDLISDAITRHYQTYQRDWGLPVAVVYSQVMLEVCIDFINRRRAEANLPAWTAHGGSIMESIERKK